MQDSKPKISWFLSEILGGEGGQHDQHCVKHKFVNLNLDSVCKYTPYQCYFLAISSIHIHLAIWRSDLQADNLHPRRVDGLLCPQPHRYEHGKVLCDCIPTTVTKSVHCVPGQVCGGSGLVPCHHPSSSPVLDTGPDQISDIQDLQICSRSTKKLATN